MAEESAKLRIPYIAAAQAQKHVTHNEAMTLLDTLVQLSVLDKDLITPPGSPAEGDSYIVAGGGGTATGAWVGWEKRVVRYIDGTWRSYLPGAGAGAGWLAWVIDEDAMYRFDGTNWDLAGIEGPPGPDPGILFEWDTGTTDADPGAGELRADNASLAAATQLFISKTSRGGSNVAAFLLSLDDSTSSSRKGILVLTRTSDEAQAVFDAGTVTDATGYVELAVSNHAGATSFSADDPISLQFWPTGDAGGAGGFNDLEGEWSAATSYDELDVVDYQGSSYVSKVGSNLNNQPDASPAKWQLLAEKGNPGGDVGAVIHAAAAKATPVDADTFGLVDSEASNVLKKVSWSNIKAALSAIFAVLGGKSGGQTLKGGTDADDGLSLQSTSGNGSSDFIRFLLGNNGAAEVMRVLRDHKVIVGHSASIPFNATTHGTLQVHTQNNGGGNGISAMRWESLNAGGGGFFAMSRSRGETPGTHTALQDGDLIGGFLYHGSDGAKFVAIASMLVHVNGTPGTDDMPGRITLNTTADGASATSEGFRLAAGGNIYFPRISTTMSAANAFINTGSSPANELLISTSSIAFKRDIEDLEPEYAEKLLQLRPVWYRSTAKADNPDWSAYGFIAEEVAEVDPRLVHWGYSEGDWEQEMVPGSE